MQSSCRLRMGRESLGRGRGLGGKAGEELPDFSIHPPLGLIHLGDRERGDRGEEQGDRKEPVGPCRHPGARGPPAAHCRGLCFHTWMPDAPPLIPTAPSLLTSLGGRHLGRAKAVGRSSGNG